ncbi:hypothetical protein C0J52_21743 [Blattella germanica]|nr:hypothetical protein C0J52_21743 [Blattella germanica]
MEKSMYLRINFRTTKWVELLNKCLELGDTPNATLKTLYKRKGPTSDPNSYRGVSLGNNPFKLLTRPEHAANEQ